MTTNQPLKIIVVEDEKLLLDIIDRKLKEIGINVDVYTTGEEALEKLKSATVLPDAIWLDYHLRGMDGKEFLDKLKSDKNLKSIPVVVVSNSANDSTITKLLEAGADKYLLKAQNRLDDIIQTIRELKK